MRPRPIGYWNGSDASTDVSASAGMEQRKADHEDGVRDEREAVRAEELARRAAEAETVKITKPVSP